MLLFLLLGTLLLGPQEPAPQQPARAPGPRTAVGGVRCVHSVSRVVFASVPEQSYRLETTLAFPARVRSYMAREGGGDGERRSLYRFGEAWWLLEPGKATSVPVPGEQRDGARLELALREAILLWPKGASWEPDPAAPDARLRSPLAGGGALVRPAGAGSAPPDLLWVVDAAGDEVARFADLRWEPADGGRWRPLELTFLAGGGKVWSETMLEVDRQAAFVDAWFQPPDRKAARSPDAFERILDSATWQRRERLDPPLAIAPAIERAESLRARVTPPAGRRLDRDLHLELDEEARVSAIVWRVSRVGSEAPPQGWVRVSGGAAACVRLPDLGALTPELLLELRTLVGSGAGGVPAAALRIPEGAGPQASGLLVQAWPEE